MNYRVVLHRLANQDLEAAYRHAAQPAPHRAAAWLTRFQQSIASLRNFPTRCAFARENSKSDVELREYHFGARPNVYRVIYTIEQGQVRILRIRRAQRRPLSRCEIREAADSGE